MMLFQNSTVKRISSVFITFSLCEQKFIFVNNSLRPTFININFVLVNHKRKVIFWLRLIHAPERICPSNQLAFFVFHTKLELCHFNQDCKVGACPNQENYYTGTRNYFRCRLMIDQSKEVLIIQLSVNISLLPYDMFDKIC